MRTNWLVALAILLLILWVVARVVGWVLGLAVHLLWVAALVLLAIWLFQKVRTRV